MADDNNILLIILVLVVAMLSIVSIVMTAGNYIDEQKLTDKVAAQVIAQIDIPTASEIAARVVIPEVKIPEFQAPVYPEFPVMKDLNNGRLDDLWENLYGEEIDELEDNAYDIAEEEFENRDYKLLTEWLEANIEGFDELKNVDVEDEEVRVIELGLDEDENKVVEVVFELEIRYTLNEGVVQRLKKDVEVTITVLFDEGDYLDSEVEMIFN